jgi:tripartite-type tricarboxylate transporter receptor subunit TctC
MNRVGRIMLAVCAGVVLAGSISSSAQGQEFYKDKTIRFIVGYSAGGSFDLYTRTIARHFSKHVPGHPTTLVENMTGAGGIIAANHLYNRVAADGLTIGAWAAPLVLQQIMGNEAIKFDGRKFGYLGVPSPYDTVCTFNDKSGIANVNDWFASKRPMKISSIGPGTSTSDIPKLLKVALNLPLDVLEGYKGGADARLAVESGEVDGYCGSWQTVETVWRSVYESGKIRAVLQATLESSPKYKHIPVAINYAKTDLARQLVSVADSAHGAQFPYTVPPGLPKDRLETLQKAFVNTLKDPDLLAEANKAKLDIEVVDGPTIAKKLRSLYDLEPAVVAKLKEVLLPKK